MYIVQIRTIVDKIIYATCDKEDLFHFLNALQESNYVMRFHVMSVGGQFINPDQLNMGGFDKWFRDLY